eukprot:1334198-Prymnesium_polylepis.1
MSGMRPRFVGMCVVRGSSGTCCSTAHRQPRALIRGPCRRRLVSTLLSPERWILRRAGRVGREYGRWGDYRRAAERVGRDG